VSSNFARPVRVCRLAARGTRLAQPRAMGTSKKTRRARCRGTTLVEVLIVVAIIGLIAGAVGVAAFSHWVGAQKQTTETNARAIRSAVRTWWSAHDPGHCPNLQELISDGTLARGSAQRDPWGGKFNIECQEDVVLVVSAGPDRQLGTDDDIEAPPT